MGRERVGEEGWRGESKGGKKGGGSRGGSGEGRGVGRGGGGDTNGGRGYAKTARQSPIMELRQRRSLLNAQGRARRAR